MEIIVITTLCVFFILMMFKSGQKLMGHLLLLLISVTKWTFVVALLFILINNVYMYQYLGWTPMSLVFGDRVYASSLKYIDKGAK